LGVIATAASIGFFVYWKRTQRALESQAMADPGYGRAEMITA
jgi:hypothetical protein